VEAQNAAASKIATAMDVGVKLTEGGHAVDQKLSGSHKEYKARKDSTKPERVQEPIVIVVDYKKKRKALKANISDDSSSSEDSSSSDDSSGDSSSSEDDEARRRELLKKERKAMKKFKKVKKKERKALKKEKKRKLKKRRSDDENIESKPKQPQGASISVSRASALSISNNFYGLDMMGAHPQP
jgi:hypothetical protein